MLYHENTLLPQGWLSLPILPALQENMYLPMQINNRLFKTRCISSVLQLDFPKGHCFTCPFFVSLYLYFHILYKLTVFLIHFFLYSRFSTTVNNRQQSCGKYRQLIVRSSMKSPFRSVVFLKVPLSGWRNTVHA